MKYKIAFYITILLIFIASCKKEPNIKITYFDGPNIVFSGKDSITSVVFSEIDPVQLNYTMAEGAEIINMTLYDGALAGNYDGNNNIFYSTLNKLRLLTNDSEGNEIRKSKVFFNVKLSNKTEICRVLTVNVENTIRLNPPLEDLYANDSQTYYYVFSAFSYIDNFFDVRIDRRVDHGTQGNIENIQPSILQPGSYENPFVDSVAIIPSDYLIGDTVYHQINIINPDNGLRSVSDWVGVIIR